ncbi:MAG TPA: NAD(P)-dependent oxidoreductase [Polyangiales bacterium]|nr:NAD(P)-dependent oxidoreductase [Polyangiales bacterium]
MSSIAVLGANGVYARHLIPRLIARGHHVRALVRRPEAAGLARACGADVRQADIFDAASLHSGLAGCELAINLATSLPGPSGRGDFAANDHLRRTGTPIWLEACRRAQVQRILQQSIAMVNAAQGGGWSDEDTAFSGAMDALAQRAIDAALAMEDSARNAGLACLILRGALFYGPGTGFDDDWFARAKAGKLRMPGDGEAYVSLIHIADMAEATLAAIENWTPGTFIVADDGPARWREVLSYVAQQLGVDAPAPGGRLGFASFRVRNARARAAFGWKPHYADYRQGLVR